MGVVQMSTSTDLNAAIDHLTVYGYCILEDRIPEDMALSMAERFLELHTDPQWNPFKIGDEYYQTLFGLLNLDDRVWNCSGHPDAVAIAEHFLGPNCRIPDACSKPTWPGAPHGPLHVDSASTFARVPSVPWMINGMWMLTEFTEENGATGVVPLSHRTRLHGPPPDITPDSPLIKPITGRPGTVMLWHAGLFHMSRANTTSDEIRVGLNSGYCPRWFNNWAEGCHQPVWPETYERMPPEMRRLCPGRLGRNRAELYE